MHASQRTYPELLAENDSLKGRVQELEHSETHLKQIEDDRRQAELDRKEEELKRKENELNRREEELKRREEGLGRRHAEPDREQKKHARSQVYTSRREHMVALEMRCATRKQHIRDFQWLCFIVLAAAVASLAIHFIPALVETLASVFLYLSGHLPSQ